MQLKRYDYHLHSALRCEAVPDKAFDPNPKKYRQVFQIKELQTGTLLSALYLIRIRENRI